MAVCGFEGDGHEAVVPAADLSTLPIVPPRPVGVEGQLVKATWYGVSLDTYRGDRPGV